MENEKHDQLQEQSSVQPEASEAAHAPETEHPKNSVADGRDMTRRNLLHLACGGYLLYLAYKLASGLISDLPQTGRTTNTVIALAGAVVFTGVGVVLLVGVARRFLRQMREDAQSEHRTDDSEHGN